MCHILKEMVGFLSNRDDPESQSGQELDTETGILKFAFSP